MDRDQIVQEKTEKTFSLSRFQHWDARRPYYPFGNTPAEDLLENCGDTSIPSVLCLGCGDLRSCFYTLWKHFDSDISTAPKRFDGVRFTLNDNVAATLARNIVFLYMCLKLPEYKEKRKKWLCAMWAIWYSLKLHSHHLEVLHFILVELISFSESFAKWSSKDNPLHSILEFNSLSCFSEVSSMWKHWLGTSPNVPTKKIVHKSRVKVLKQSINDYTEHSMYLSLNNTLIYPDTIQNGLEKVSAQVPEVNSYLKTGCSFAELVFSQNIPARKYMKLNLTMIESEDWTYNCHYGLVPFEGYYHTVKFTPKKVGLTEHEDFYSIFVPEESFKLTPFLANSVQQFCMWIQSSNRALKNKNVSISFRLDIQHCLALCQQQNKINQRVMQSDGRVSMLEYDIITTSNLMDHLNPSNLIVACTPLLKDNGALITSSMNCKYCSNTGEELLNLYFGFSSQLFPVILGVRCISHEGPEYSNPVKINPSPPDLSHEKLMPHFRTFIWVKESNAQQIVLHQLPEVIEGNITEAFVNILGSYSYSLINYGPGDSAPILSHNCIETAIGILNTFLCLSKNSTPPFSYWEPLCQKLKKFSGPYLHSLQTQFLLHDLHIHLTVSDKTCPKCQQKSLQDFLGFFCFSFTDNIPTSFFMAFLHKYSTTDAHVLLKKALDGNDVHIFDCFDGNYAEDQIMLNFVVPLKFLEQHYKVTLVCVCRRKDLNENFMETIGSCNLSDICKPWTQYNFNSVKPTSKSHFSSDLGTVSEYVCDSHQSKTKFSLSEQASEYVKTSALTTSKISSRHITLHCRDLKYDLHFNFPIDYSSLEMTHISEGQVLIICPRQPYSLKEERPCFIATPDHMISLPVYALNPSYLTSAVNGKIAETKLLTFFQSFFKYVLKFSFFCIQTSRGACKCLILINNVLFDYRHKTPAIDLVYCFVEGLDSSTIISEWNSIANSSSNQNITVDKESLESLKEIFGYFASRTNGTLQSAGDSSKYFILRQSNLDFAFTRAVIYSPLQDPDQVLYGAGDLAMAFNLLNVMPIIGGDKCISCGKITFTVKKCGKCKAVGYCSKACQTKHWSEHKKECSMMSKSLRPAYLNSELQVMLNRLKDSVQHQTAIAAQVKAQTESDRCSYCFNTSENLKKCTRCMKVKYCSRSCQSEDWQMHKLACQRVSTFNSCSTPATAKSISASAKSTSASVGFCSKPASSNPALASSIPAFVSSISASVSSTSASVRSTSASVSSTSASVSSTSASVSSTSTPTNSTSSPTAVQAKIPILTSEGCSYCHNISENLKKCSRCSKVKYCDTTCQSNDWAKHKSVCWLDSTPNSHSISASTDSNPGNNRFVDTSAARSSHVSVRTTSASPSSTSLDEVTYAQAKSLPLEIERCSHCNNASESLKKCSRCKKVKYCSTTCQRKDWPKHKSVCGLDTHGFTPMSTSCTQTSTNVNPVCSFPTSTSSTSAALPLTSVQAAGTFTQKGPTEKTRSTTCVGNDHRRCS